MGLVHVLVLILVINAARLHSVSGDNLGVAETGSPADPNELTKCARPCETQPCDCEPDQRCCKQESCGFICINVPSSTTIADNATCKAPCPQYNNPKKL